MATPDLHKAEHFRAFVPKEGGILAKLEKDAQENDIPIIGPVLAKFLYILTRSIGAKRVLELGTATGYSAIWLARAVKPVGGRVVSIERDQGTVNKAVANIYEADLTDNVDVMQGDARDIMGQFADGHFDLVFNDVEKEYYSPLLEPCVRVLRPGGLMLFDNTAFKSAGDILDATFDHPGLETVHLYGFFPDHSPDFDEITIYVNYHPMNWVA